MFGILRPFWIVLEDSSAGHLKIFFNVSLVFFFRGGMMHVRKAVFVIRRLLVSEEKFVWFSEEKGVTYVCLRCVVSSPSVVRPSLMLVGNNKVVEDEVRWRRSKGVVMNSFYLFRNSKSAIRDHQFIAVGDMVNCLALYFLRQQMNYETLLYQHTTTKVLYLQLWIFGLFLVLQDSWCLGLLVLETR